MDIELLRGFFLWCTIVNSALLALSFLICAFAGDWVHRMHGRWFPMSRETFSVVIYAFLGIYKMFILFFNLVPYIVLGVLA